MLKSTLPKLRIVEASTILGNLVSMQYKGKGNVRKNIMEMPNLTAKLSSLRLELSDDVLVHMVFISLIAQFNQFKVSSLQQNWLFIA